MHVERILKGALWFSTVESNQWTRSELDGTHTFLLSFFLSRAWRAFRYSLQYNSVVIALHHCLVYQLQEPASKCKSAKVRSSYADLTPSGHGCRSKTELFLKAICNRKLLWSKSQIVDNYWSKNNKLIYFLWMYKGVCECMYV